MRKRTSRRTEAELPDDVSRLRGWRRARPVVDLTRAKVPTRRITINLDEDVIAIFKADALRGGLPYQRAINQALRSHLRTREQSAKERAADLVLEALDDEAVILRLRSIL
jgi:uncharacterized protein (DUF4415 family)